jgi:hypothetical protein
MVRLLLEKGADLKTKTQVSAARACMGGMVVTDLLLFFLRVLFLTFIMHIHNLVTPNFMSPFPNIYILTGKEDESVGGEARDIEEISGLLVSLRTPKSRARRQYHNFLQAC